MAKTATVALVGSDTLLGREIRDIVATSAPELGVRLLAADEETPGTLTRVGDEAAIVSGLEAASLADARVVFLTGSPEASRKTLEMAGDSIPVIDLTYAAEEMPAARLRAPVVEDGEPEDGTVHVIAHPAAIALALFLRRLHVNDPIRRSVIQIAAPASERGAEAVEELQQQTVNLLSFKPLPQAIFDTQLGFSMLARYGEEAPTPLE